MSGIVLVPGFANGEDEYRSVVRLIERDHEVSMVSFARLATVTLDSLADRVEDAAARLGTTSFGIVGTSFGCLAAVHCAARAPHALEHLSLLAGWLSPSSSLRYFGQLCDATRHDPALFSLALQGLFFSPQARERRVAPLAGDDAAQRVHAASTLDVSASAAMVTTPTLVVSARLDNLVSPWQSKLIFGAIGNSRLAEMDSGHSLLLERPVQTLALLEEFWNDPEATARGSIVSGMSA